VAGSGVLSKNEFITGITYFILFSLLFYFNSCPGICPMSSMAEVGCIHHFNGGFCMALETAHAFYLVTE
jgi:hypothetical protein